MSEEKKQISLTRRLLQQYKKSFVEKTSITSFLTIALIICLIPAYFIPATLIFSVPLIALPVFLGFITCNMSFRFKAPRTTNVLIGFKMYFSKLFFGVFCYLGAILKSFIVYLSFSTILTLILHFAIGMKDPSYVEIFNRAISVTSNAELANIIEELQGNSTFLKIENFSILVSFGLASYMFFHHILTHSFKVQYNLLSKQPIPSVALNYLHKKAFPKFRKDFYNDYYSTFWLLIILYVAGYVGGAFLSILVFQRSGAQAAIISTFFGIILSVFYLPYMYDVYQLMYPIDSLYYLKAYKDLLLAMDIPELKLSPQDQQEMDQMIDEFEKMLEMAKKEMELEKEKKKAKRKNKKQ